MRSITLELEQRYHGHNRACFDWHLELLAHKYILRYLSLRDRLTCLKLVSHYSKGEHLHLRMALLVTFFD